ncbi:hypothetical protein [Candidatus Nanohalococcus occultus]|uniref:Uncharacterized protein n=1 Tax=Candidatus Nanohalococcus occultus TaxID=2978047 RepID=A0ABY8CK69_9ARCH|nr:hypothetical protein SVXNc_0707 [Candidatus Nanohaloarchaeota archaeon SVXNc]
MNAALKILFGALMVVVGVFSTVTFFNELLTLAKAAIGPVLVLLGAFIIWLESDEWKMQRTEKSKEQKSQGLQREFEPQNAVEQDTTQKMNYDDVLSGTVQEVKDAVREMADPDYRAILEAEKRGKDRKTVREFLERRVD